MIGKTVAMSKIGNEIGVNAVELVEAVEGTLYCYEPLEGTEESSERLT